MSIYIAHVCNVHRLDYIHIFSFACGFSSNNWLKVQLPQLITEIAKTVTFFSQEYQHIWKIVKRGISNVRIHEISVLKYFNKYVNCWCIDDFGTSKLWFFSNMRVGVAILHIGFFQCSNSKSFIAEYWGEFLVVWLVAVSDSTLMIIRGSFSNKTLNKTVKIVVIFTFPLYR